MAEPMQVRNETVVQGSIMAMYGRSRGRLCFAAAIMLLASTAGAQTGAGADNAAQEKRNGRFDRAGEIATQPARDVGMRKVTIPPVLQSAINSPYGTEGTRNCAQIATSLKNLNTVLGPDFVAGAATNENRASKIAEAGGKTVVNSLIPFRGLVREMTGAAPAQRRLNAAIDAGYARRGFLRGLQISRKCRA